jgi:hypothetical protein
MIASTDGSLWVALDQFWLTLALVGIPGVLGGLTNAVSIFLPSAGGEGGKLPSSGDSPKRSYYLAYGITGFGGSLAALLVILWAGKFPGDIANLQALLTLACMGFVAGYMANRLLPAIANSLYKKLTDLSERQDDLAKRSEVGIGNAVSLSTELTAAREYLSGESFVAGQTEKLIASLSSLVKAYPTNRPLNILLSRLWEEARYDRKKALDVLGAFIQAKLDAKQRDEDLATAYWNAANYHEDDFREMNRPELRTQTVEALRKALEIAPSYLEELLRDKDFAGLRESDEGKALLKDFGAKNGS